MAVKDIVGQIEARASAEPIRQPSVGSLGAARSPRSPEAAQARRQSLPPQSSPAVVGNPSSALPPPRPARFVRHPLLQTPSSASSSPSPDRTSAPAKRTSLGSAPSPLSPPAGPPTSRVGADASRRLSAEPARGSASPISPSPSSPSVPRSTDVRTAQNTLRRTSLPPPSRDSFSGSTMTANALSGRPSFDYIEDMPPRYSPIGTGRRQSYAASSTVELVPLKPLGEVWDDQPPSPTSTLIPLPTGQNLRTSHRAVPAKTVFAPTAPPLHLPKLDEHLSGMSAPSFSSYPKREPVGPGSGKGKSKAGSSADVFPPMDMLAQTKLSIDDLEHNAVVPPSWRDRNTIFGGLVSAFLGITGSSAIAKHYSLQGVYNTVQMFALVLGAAVPAETITEGWRKIFLGTIPNVLALNFGSTMVQSLIFLVVFLVIACLLLYAFHKSTSRLATTATREGLQPQYDGSGWGVVITSFVLTILYLPLSTIALHALVWSSDFWVVPNPYLNSTVSPAQLPSLGPAEVYRQPLDFCYTTTMLKDQINYAPVIVLISAFTFIMMTFWFPVRLARAVKLAVPHVDPYTELGKKRTPDEMESEYMRLMDRDISPFAFLYNDFRRKWASYKSIYLWAKLSTLLIVAVLDPDNCIFRNADRNAVNVARQSVLVVAMLVFFLVQCFLAPFIDPVSNASEWISRLNYLSTSTVGLFVALNVPGSSILNGPILYVIYIITYGLSIYFSIINFSFIRRWVKRVTQRIDFSIDIFSPHIDISSTSPHVRRRIWQESVSVLLLTAPECKIPLSQKMSFVIHREHEWPPYLLDFHNTPAERHVENLKILREVGWPTYLNGIALHTAPQATRFRELERAILRQFIGPDAHWCNPAVPPVPGQMSYFGSAWWIPFPPTLVMHYDAGHFDTLTTMQEFEDFVYQNSTRHMERRRQVRRALRALDGQVVHWPYTHTEFIGSRKSLFGGPSYSAQKTQHFRHCVFQIKRHGELAWNRVQLGSGFEVVLTYSDAVQVDGTVIGLDEDFDLTPSLARFLMLNNALMQGRLHAIDTALYTYRKHFTREMKHKEKVLSYRFLSRVYNSPDDPARIAENALEIEQDLRVRTVLLSHEDAFNAAHERMSLVCSTPVRTWWYIFWDDFWSPLSLTTSSMTTPSTNFKPVPFPPLLRKPRNPAEGQRLYDHIRTVAFALDALTALSPSLQGSPIHIGIEPILAAAIPLIGPLIGAALGLYIVFLSWACFGVSLDTVGRMLINIVIDVFAGWIPIFGPIIDVTFKCNLANLSLLENHLKTSKWAVLIIPPPQRWFGGLGDFLSGRSTRKAQPSSFPMEPMD